MIRFSVITFVIFFSFHLFAIDLIQKSNGYFLKGSCEQAKKEISYFSSASVQCVCNNGECLTELNSHLPARINELIHAESSLKPGPNCWNSVLYTLGLHQAPHFSSQEIRFWLSTPLCKERKGEALPGDIINIRETSPEGEIAEVHSYRKLSPSIAFNKNGSRIHEPYQLIKPESYLDLRNIPLECRFIESSEALEGGCTFFAQAYSCKNLDQVLVRLDGTSETKLLRSELNQLSDQAKRATFSSEELNWQDLKSRSQAIKAQALEKMDFAEVDETSFQIKELLEKASRDLCSTCSEEELEPWQNYLPEIYLYAFPEMDLKVFHPSIRNAIERARELRQPSPTSMEDRLMWTNIYLTARSLEDQFDWLATGRN